MPTTPLLPLALGAGVLLLASSRPRRSRRSGTAVDRAPSHQFLDLEKGPEPDPCLGEAYSQTPQPLLAEAYAGLKDNAKALYGDSAVFYLSPEAQGKAFEMIAYLRVNEPYVDPVIRTAFELAPSCDWTSGALGIAGGDAGGWSPAMVAFRNSLEKMAQIIDKELEDLPPRSHPWDTEPLLRDGMTLKFESGAGKLSFELPSDDATISLAVSPPNAAGAIVGGLHKHVMITEGDQMVEKPAVNMWLFIPPGSLEKAASIQLMAASASGVTSGTVKLVRE